MATYTPSKSTHQTLTANAVDTVTLQGEFDAIEVVNWDTLGKIYVRTDGTAPGVAADNNLVIGPGQALLIPTPYPAGSADGVDAVKLISTVACAYSVTGI